MKAATYYGEHDLRVEEVPAPVELGPHETLLRPLFAGICGTDVHEYANGPDLIPIEHDPTTGQPQPKILGHEFSAEVLQIGEDVTTVGPGQLVAVRPGMWCGKCPTCLKGYLTSCINFGAVGLGHQWGGLAELAVVDETQAIPMPAKVSPQQAAMLEPLGVAAHAFDQLSLLAGSRVLITGGGPIGSLAALYAHAAGAGEITVSEPNPARRQLLEALNVGRVIAPETASSVLVEGVDGCLEASGHPAGLALCVDSLLPGGTIVQAGLHSAPVPLDVKALNLKQATLIGSWCWPVTGWERLARLIGIGRLPVEKLITATINLDTIVDEGILALMDPAANHQKILIDVAGPTH